jgi:hypothetical protein
MSPRAYEIEAGGVDAVYLAHRKTAEERNLLEWSRTCYTLRWFVTCLPSTVSLLTSARNLLQAFVADALMARWIPNFSAVK